MIETVTGKVINIKRRRVDDTNKVELPEFKSNYNYIVISEIRLNKIIYQLNLLAEMQQLNNAVYTVKDIKSLISDIQYTLDVVEDKLITSSVDFGITKEVSEDNE